MEVTVKEWISFEEADQYTENDAGGIGGWIKGQNFDEYLTKYNSAYHPYLKAIRNSVVENGLKLTGADHQEAHNGVPLFSDDTVSTFSFRAWGDLMAAIWNSEEPGATYQYMDFYM